MIICSKLLCLGGIKVEALKIILTILFVCVCIALSIVVMLQEGKTKGLGAISGESVQENTPHWRQIKGRSRESRLIKMTVILSVIFFVLALVLNRII